MELNETLSSPFPTAPGFYLQHHPLSVQRLPGVAVKVTKLVWVRQGFEEHSHTALKGSSSPQYSFF